MSLEKGGKSRWKYKGQVTEQCAGPCQSGITLLWGGRGGSMRTQKAPLGEVKGSVPPQSWISCPQHVPPVELSCPNPIPLIPEWFSPPSWDFWEEQNPEATFAPLCDPTERGCAFPAPFPAPRCLSPSLFSLSPCWGGTGSCPAGVTCCHSRASPGCPASTPVPLWDPGV